MVWIVKEDNRLEQVRWMLRGIIESRRERVLTQEEREELSNLYKEMFRLEKLEREGLPIPPREDTKK